MTKSGKRASVRADRCGGDDSLGIVTNEQQEEVGRYAMPDAEAVANIAALEAKYALSVMPYFFTQDPDYERVKQLVVDGLVAGKIPQGVATLTTAIDTLKVAEYLTPLLQHQLEK